VLIVEPARNYSILVGGHLVSGMRWHKTGQAALGRRIRCAGPGISIGCTSGVVWPSPSRESPPLAKGASCKGVVRAQSSPLPACDTSAASSMGRQPRVKRRQSRIRVRVYCCRTGTASVKPRARQSRNMTSKTSKLVALPSCQLLPVSLCST
jgi:hypothetical protein